MGRIHTLTTALAILVLGAITAGCAGSTRYSVGPERPMIQNTAYPAENLDEIDVAEEVPWDRCDGECRYREAMRTCSTTVVMAGTQRQRAYADLMRFRGDRAAFRAAIMRNCPQPSGQRFAYREGAMYRPGAISSQQGKLYCPVLGSPAFLRDNPKPPGRQGCQMVAKVPNKPCGGWWCPSIVR